MNGGEARITLLIGDEEYDWMTDSDVRMTETATGYHLHFGAGDETGWHDDLLGRDLTDLVDGEVVATYDDTTYSGTIVRADNTGLLFDDDR